MCSYLFKLNTDFCLLSIQQTKLLCKRRQRNNEVQISYKRTAKFHQITAIIISTAVFTYDHFSLKLEGERGILGVGVSVYLCESVGTVLTRVTVIVPLYKLGCGAIFGSKRI